MEVKFRRITSNFTLHFDQECASHVYGNFINETPLDLTCTFLIEIQCKITCDTSKFVFHI